MHQNGEKYRIFSGDQPCNRTTGKVVISSILLIDLFCSSYPGKQLQTNQRSAIGSVYAGLNISAFLFLLLISISPCSIAEGTKQLEPPGSPDSSYCRIALTQNPDDHRLPFALIGCSADYRLNIHISNHQNEKIYIGFGNITDYEESDVYSDVRFQVRAPDGTIVPGFILHTMPESTGDQGFIEAREKALAGPNINSTNPLGYTPLQVDPTMNGDYVLEFDIPPMERNEARILKYFDITVANGINPIQGRVWSKAWQLSTSRTNADFRSSWSKMYIYSNDSITTRFDCNGLAGGIWSIYSNEWGCSTTGSWTERRKSIEGNATVQPQYKIFLNDPDPIAYPSGVPGKLNFFQIIPHDCDTVITFSANVSKGGNIQIILDLPPYNPNTVAAEDIQLGYTVTAGYNILLPPWNGKNAQGIPVPNGVLANARISFLNGLTNIPLYDVEDNPNGFKVDIQRPAPQNGITKLRLFWDDTKLPAELNPTSNITEGCLYDETQLITGCHKWSDTPLIGDINTLNTWWYYSTEENLTLPLTLKFGPPTGKIDGPGAMCKGQSIIFRTKTIPFATTYHWHVSGPGYDQDFTRNYPDTTLGIVVQLSMNPGPYLVSVYGDNPLCGSGLPTSFQTILYDNSPPPVAGPIQSCTGTTVSYSVPGTYTNVIWTVNKGIVVSPQGTGSISILWNEYGTDTIRSVTTSTECGTRTSFLPVTIYPSAHPAFTIMPDTITCPGIPLTIQDQSYLSSGTIVARSFNWGDGIVVSGNDLQSNHTYLSTGILTTILKVTTDKGCESEASRVLRVISNPVASFSVYRNCVNDSVQFHDNSTGIDLDSWNWTFDDHFNWMMNNDSREPMAGSGEDPFASIRLIVKNSHGCSDTLNKTIDLHPHPKAGFSHELPCRDATVLFHDQSIPADTALSSYIWRVDNLQGLDEWYSGNPARIIFHNEGTNLVILKATDIYGCSDTAAALIEVLPLPESSFRYTENTGNIEGQIQFTNESTGADSYFWDFGNQLTSSQSNPVTKYDQEGNYRIMLVATSAEGCNDTSAQSYYFLPGLWLPNAFSPNQDGHNDVFRPVSSRTTLQPYTLWIFNHWGELIFSSSDPAKGWDGTFNGKACSSGDYIYLIRYSESGKEHAALTTRKGFVTLIR